MWNGAGEYGARSTGMRDWNQSTVGWRGFGNLPGTAAAGLVMRRHVCAPVPPCRPSSHDHQRRLASLPAPGSRLGSGHGAQCRVLVSVRCAAFVPVVPLKLLRVLSSPSPGHLGRADSVTDAPRTRPKAPRAVSREKAGKKSRPRSLTSGTVGAE